MNTSYLCDTVRFKISKRTPQYTSNKKDCTITLTGTKFKFQASLIIPHYLLGQVQVDQLTNKQYTTNGS